MPTDGIPPMGPLAPIVDQMRDLADEELPTPRSCRINLWDDGTFDVVIWNGSGEGQEFLRYERTTAEIIWGYQRGHELQSESLSGGETLHTPTFEEFEARVVAQVDPPYK